MKSEQELIQLASDYQFKTKELEKAYLTYNEFVENYPDSPNMSTVRKMMSLIESQDANIKQNIKAAIEKTQEEKKRINSNMILSTCPSLEGYRIVEHLGLVFGECVYKTGFLKSLSASLNNLGDMFTMEDNELSGSALVLEDARAYATSKMKNAAIQKGANAVIGIDSESSFGGEAVIHITIYGSAVKIEPINPVSES